MTQWIELESRPDADLGSVDVGALTPDSLAELSADAIRNLPLGGTRHPTRVGDVFEVRGTAVDSAVRLIAGPVRIDGVGRGMRSGRIEVIGGAGHWCGQDMAGGELVVRGDAGHAAGVGQRGGRIAIGGSVGDYAGGVSERSGRSMRGGDLLVAGSAGRFVGERLRRGMILVGGSAGELGAAGMIAGTIVVLGGIGEHWAGGMRRGSVVLRQGATAGAWLAELTEPRAFELSFLSLMWKYLRGVAADLAVELPRSRWASRSVGDLCCGGQGEVLTVEVG